jgi:hypothetical protein
MQDSNPGLQHRDSSGGVAVGLHAPGLSHTHGVRCYPSEDCTFPQVFYILYIIYI